MVDKIMSQDTQQKNSQVASAASKKKFSKRKAAGKLLGLLLRTILFTIMLLMLLGLGAWLVCIRIMNAQQISETLAQRLQQLFDRPVVISSLNLKFVNMVELKGFAVLDNEVHPGAPFLSTDSVIIRYQLLPLLDRQLIIDEVTLNHPRIDIVRAEEGVYNVPPVRASSSHGTYVSKSTGENITIHIDDWTIADGVVSYLDLESGVGHAVYGLNMHFNNLHFDEPSHFTMETILRNRWGDGISDVEINGDGQVDFANFDWEKFALRDFKVQVAVFQKPVQITADLDNLRNPSFTAKVEVPAFDQQNLSVFSEKLPAFSVPASTITLKGGLDGSFTHLSIMEAIIKNKLTSTTLSGQADFGVTPFTADLAVKTGWADLAQLSKLWPALARFKLTGKGSLSASVLHQDGKYQLPQVTLGAQQVGGSFWGFETQGVSGEFIAKKDFSDLYAKTTEGHIQVANTVFDKFNMTGSYRGGNVYAYIGSALLNEVPLKLRLSIDNIKSNRRRISTNIYLKDFDPMAFIGVVSDFVDVISAISTKPGKPTPRQTGDLAWMRNFRDRLPEFMPNFAGTLYADTFSSAVLSGKQFNAEFNFRGMLPGASKLDGTLDMKLENGIIHQMEKVAEEQQALNVTYTPFIMLHRMESSGSFKVGEVLKDVAFNEMAASVDFKKGTMIINNAFTQGPVISAAVSGWTDWVRETFELVIWTMITPSSHRGILAENLTDENGNPALAFKVSSSMLKPKLEMLRAKKTNEQIDAARKRGLRTDFTKSRDFVKGEFNAKK